MLTLEQSRPIARCTAVPGHQVSARVYFSVTLVAVLIVLLLDVWLGLRKPLQDVQVPGIVLQDQDPLDVKMTALRLASEQNTLLLGSSTIAITAGADFVGQSGYAAVRTQMQRFDSTFERSLGVAMRTMNLGISGAMVDEDRAVLQTAIDCHKTPKVVFLCLAPRDFTDNCKPDGEHVIRYLSSCQPLNKLLQSDAPLDRKIYNIASQSYLYSRRGDLGVIISSAARKFVDSFAPVKFDSSATTAKDATAKQDHGKFAVSSYYDQAFNPLNQSRVDSEFRQLDQIFELCRSAQILLVVVDMPRTQENQSKIPEPFKSTYASRLESACRASNVPFIGFRPGEFGENEFWDEVHLRPEASLKFFDRLAERIESDDALCHRLRATLHGGQ